MSRQARHDNKGGRNGRPIYSKLFYRNVLKNSLKELPAFCY